MGHGAIRRSQRLYRYHIQCVRTQSLGLHRELYVGLNISPIRIKSLDGPGSISRVLAEVRNMRLRTSVQPAE